MLTAEERTAALDKGMAEILRGSIAVLHSTGLPAGANIRVLVATAPVEVSVEVWWSGARVFRRVVDANGSTIDTQGVG